MTENQRDYLADLAGQKGIVLENTDNVSVAWASAKIEELKALPDAEFDEVTPELNAKLDTRIVKVAKGVRKWTLSK